MFTPEPLLKVATVKLLIQAGLTLETTGTELCRLGHLHLETRTNRQLSLIAHGPNRKRKVMGICRRQRSDLISLKK
jgi:hypothetical protein